MGQVLIRKVRRQGRRDPKKKITRAQLSGVPYTPRMGSSATFTLKPLGEEFGFNIVDISGILVQKLQMYFRDGGTKPVQEPVVRLSEASTSVHNFGHILCHCFLSDSVFENNNIAFILIRDGGHE
jgi:hypothetical protein